MTKFKKNNMQDTTARQTNCSKVISVLYLVVACEFLSLLPEEVSKTLESRKLYMYM